MFYIDFTKSVWFCSVLRALPLSTRPPRHLNSTLFNIHSFNISGNVGVFQVPEFPNKSGNRHFTVFMSGYFPVFQSWATWGYIFGYTDFQLGQGLLWWMKGFIQFK